ncbi:MAG TPA: ABC transporter substrate-binding protein [Acidimicrobiia bacterium]|jgi:branched-chain amino acid transport system substrate-binding protein
MRALAVLATLSVASVGVLATGAAAQSGSTPGVTKDSVKVGFISSETGVAASNFVGAPKGCQARIDAENAKGGVNGRKIDIVAIDDKSSGANLTSAKDLVQNQDAFAVVNDSPFAFQTYRYLVDSGVPMIGGGFDGSYYYDQGNENVISSLGDGTPVPGITTDTTTNVMKKLGATKAAAIGYGVSPSSSETAKATVDYAAKASGLKPGYLNTAVDFGATDVGPIVLGIANSGSDGVYLPLDSNTNFAIIQGLQQNGTDMKATVSATGYSQALLEQPIAKTITTHDLLQTSYKPITLNDPNVKTFVKNIKKYAGITGVPNYGVFTGYITCDLVVLGLQNAGKNPTRKSFVDGIRNTNGGKYNSAGLTCKDVDLSYAHFGKISSTPGCIYYVSVKNGKFVPYNGGKPITGKTVGDPAIIKKYTESGGTGVATTTAPPST